VDVADLAIFTPAWLSQAGDTHWNPNCNINTPADNHINELDFSTLSANWTVGTVPTIPGDFDKDGDVDRADLATLTQAWLSEPGNPKWNPDCDIGIPVDNSINIQDLAVFSGNWGFSIKY
jgi:hypothetical protein